MMFGRLPVDKVKYAAALKLESVMRPRAELPPVPQRFVFDEAYPSPPIPVSMLGNDIHGDCVIVARANGQLRFERKEQGTVIPITTDDVLAQWRRENGNTENGLYMLDSMESWRAQGWPLGGRSYTSHAYATVDPCSTEKLRAALYLLGPLQIGFSLPYSVTNDMGNDEVWDLHGDVYDQINPDAGHAIAIIGFDEAENWLGVTWGRLQWMSPAWLEGYADEIYAVVDSRDSWVMGSVVDEEALEAYLPEVQA